MAEFNRPDAPMENSPKDTIRLIADSALQAGITLFGGLLGSGILSTSTAVVQSIRKNNNFNSDHVFYINAHEEREAGRCIEASVDAWIDKYEGSHLLFVLDGLHDEKTMTVALELASLGHSVLGITECYRPISLAGVLGCSVDWAGDDIKSRVTADLLSYLNMIGLQKNANAIVTCNLTYRDKQDFVALLNDQGVDRVNDELNALGVIRS